MKKIKLYFPLLCLFLFSACHLSIKPEELYGKWKYTLLENLHGNPPSSEPDWQLKMEHPYIEFTKSDSLVIWWSGKLLSRGTFRTDGKKIMFKEVLEGGQTREFPFVVSQLTDKIIVFETEGDEGSRVTAIKQ